MATEAGILIKLGLDATSLQRGLTGVAAQTKSFAQEQLASFTKAFAVASIIAGIRELGKDMVQLRREAEDKGTSTDFLQGFAKATVKFGGTAEDAGIAIDRLLIKVGEAREQGGAAADGFKRYGIALKTVEGFATTTEEILRQIADRYKETVDPASRAALANEFFSKSGLRINNVLELGSKGMDDYIAKQKALGKIVDAEKVNALADAYLNVAAAQSTAGSALTIAAGYAAETVAVLSGFLGALSAGVGSDAAAVAAVQSNKAAKSEGERRSMLAESKKNLDEMVKLSKEYADTMRDVEGATGQFDINDALREELGLRMKLAGMKDGDSRRAQTQAGIEAAIGKRAVLELSQKQDALRELNRVAGELEEEIRGLGFGDDAKLEKEKKRVELAKMLKDIAKGAADIEKVKLDLMEKQADAQARATKASASLADAKGERFKFSLEDLAAGNTRNLRGQIRDDVFSAREVQNLEANARRQNELGNIGERDRLQSLADDRRRSIGSLRASDREPFKGVEDEVKESNRHLKEIKAGIGEVNKLK
jgi:hypothetical protein